MVQVGKPVSPRTRANSLPFQASSSGEVALDENEFKVALEKSGFSGNASQVWRQLGSGDGPRSATSTARDLSVDRAQQAQRNADVARETASTRSERRSNSASSAQRSRSGAAPPTSGPGAKEKGSGTLSRATWAGP